MILRRSFRFVLAANVGALTLQCDSAQPKEKEFKSWCPFAHMMKWAGLLPPPEWHPPIDEPSVNYNKSHFPEGLNANFLNETEEMCCMKYSGKDGLFENVEQREIAKYAKEIIATLRHYGLQPGSTAADIGAGTGFITSLLSTAVGESGTVYAQEISPGFVSLLRKKKEQEKWHNVHIVKADAKHSNLPRESLDLALICDVYHHFEYPHTAMYSIRAAMKPTGRLVVIDFYRDESRIWSRPKGWVTDHVRADKDVFLKEIEASGFKLVEDVQVKGMQENYFLVFEVAE